MYSNRFGSSFIARFFKRRVGFYPLIHHDAEYPNHLSEFMCSTKLPTFYHEGEDKKEDFLAQKLDKYSLDHSSSRKSSTKSTIKKRRTLKGTSFKTKVKMVCAKVLEASSRGSPHLSELFVGNQLLFINVPINIKLSEKMSSKSPSHQCNAQVR